MKSIVLFFTLIIGQFISAQSAADTTLAFRSFDDEVGLNVERENGLVKMLIYVKDPTQFHHIIIERSAETPNYFGKCRYLLSANLVLKDGMMVDYDRFPFSAAKDVYYRIKTVTVDGIERSYPPVLLAALRK